MSDWTDGYVTDIGYTFDYFQELNPIRSKMAFLVAGFVPPSEGGVHCELGFGQGISANIHAASSNSTWYGNDFNPSQASFAKELATASGANAHLTDEAFTDFCTRTDLPDFDSISLHGIWSWISDENRTVIVDFVRRKLKVGGVLYISYNTQPGWAAMAPVRDLLKEHSDVMGNVGGGMTKRVDSALEFADKLMATNPVFLKANPLVAEKLKKLKEHNRNYLAHEYFNRDWQPMPFSKMLQWLKPAKLSFACSANYLSHVNDLNLTPDQATFLKEISDPMFQENVRDFIVNQQFRKDYWIKGARKLNLIDQELAYREQKVMLGVPRESVTLKFSVVLGEATVQEEVYNPILNMLGDYKPKTLGQIEQGLKGQGINFPQIVQAVLVLSSNATLVTVQDEATINKAKKYTDRLNGWLINKSRSGNEVGFLASPVSGGGITVRRFQQLFLLAISRGHKQPADWAQFVWAILSAQGQRLVKEGNALDSAENNLTELVAQAQTFADKQLPVLKALQIA
jgi:SAM-dependent methyltransferase